MEAPQIEICAIATLLTVHEQSGRNDDPVKVKGMENIAAVSAVKVKEKCL